MAIFCNLIGYFNRGTDDRTPPRTAGIGFTTAEGGIIAANIIDIAGDSGGRASQLGSSRVKYFENRNSEGALLRGYNRNTHGFAPDLSDRIESALLLSL